MMLAWTFALCLHLPIIFKVFFYLENLAFKALSRDLGVCLYDSFIQDFEDFYPNQRFGYLPYMGLGYHRHS